MGEVANSKLVYVIVADVGAEKRGNTVWHLVQIWKLKFGHKDKVLLRL